MRHNINDGLNIAPIPDDRRNLDVSQLNTSISEAEIVESIKHLHIKKSPGPDGICIELYKYIMHIITPYLK